ncbi:hypothetical protein, partial [Glaesserella parasuis]|uniref:hypothetical protein n=1 Tax=Glaesserella parasuis TaxID=738 RepID=UPI001BE43C8D
AYATERVLALGTPKLWITLWFMLLVYYNFNIQGANYISPKIIGNIWGKCNLPLQIIFFPVLQSSLALGG